ncbi:MAG: ROK family protein [Cetobacterium sp.]
MSSNVTGAVISNNLILKGFLNIAGSLGHISIDKNGRSCKCGRNGCVENYISDISLEKEYNDTIENLIENYHKNSKSEKIIIQNFVQNLCFLLNDLIFIFNPEIILINSKILKSIKELKIMIKDRLVLPITKTQNIEIIDLKDEEFIKSCSSLIFTKYINSNLWIDSNL